MTAQTAPLRASGPGRILIQVRRHHSRSWFQRERMRDGECSAGDKTSPVYYGVGFFVSRFSFLVSRFSFWVSSGASGWFCVWRCVVRKWLDCWWLLMCFGWECSGNLKMRHWAGPGTGVATRVGVAIIIYTDRVRLMLPGWLGESW